MSSANTSGEANRDDGCEWYFGVPFESKRKAAAVKERELKVGDRVEVNVDRYPVKAGRGRRGKIKEVLSHGYTVRLDNSDDGFEWFFYPGDCNLLPPTFATGTRVRVSRNTNHYAVGDTGTVTVSSDESVGVCMDNGRYWSFKPEDLAVVESEAVARLCSQSNPEQDNVIRVGEFKAHLGDVAAVAFGGTPEPCIVARVDDGQPRPASWPHVHQSAADATKEAERLASVNPGKQFDVYQRVTGRVGDVQVREVA